MNINKRAKVVVAAVALIGTAGIAGNAFTGTGVTNNAPASQFVGGQVSQVVKGATLTNVQYGFSDPPVNLNLHQIRLTFAGTDTNGKAVTVVPTGVSVLGSAWTCGNVVLGVSNCTNAGTDTTGMDGLTITVASDQPPLP
jgi:hypothetical protein